MCAGMRLLRFTARVDHSVMMSATGGGGGGYKNKPVIVGRIYHCFSGNDKQQKNKPVIVVRIKIDW